VQRAVALVREGKFDLAGHLALETHAAEIGDLMLDFLGRTVIPRVVS
jgi:hypothetical protein